MNNFSLLLLKAHEDASALVAVIGELRSDDKYKMLYLRPQTVAKVLDITPHKSRTLKNEEHYRLNVFLPFIDHMLRHFNERFPQQLMPALLSWHIIPANVHALTSNHVESMKLEYEHDLLSKSTFDQEVHRWKTLCESNREITSSLAGTVHLAL